MNVGEDIDGSGLAATLETSKSLHFCVCVCMSDGDTYAGMEDFVYLHMFGCGSML